MEETRRLREPVAWITLASGVAILLGALLELTLDEDLSYFGGTFGLKATWSLAPIFGVATVLLPAIAILVVTHAGGPTAHARLITIIAMVVEGIGALLALVSLGGSLFGNVPNAMHGVYFFYWLGVLGLYGAALYVGFAVLGAQSMQPVPRAMPQNYPGYPQMAPGQPGYPEAGPQGPGAPDPNAAGQGWSSGYGQPGAFGSAPGAWPADAQAGSGPQQQAGGWPSGYGQPSGAQQQAGWPSGYGQPSGSQPAWGGDYQQPAADPYSGQANYSGQAGYGDQGYGYGQQGYDQSSADDYGRGDAQRAGSSFDALFGQDPNADDEDDVQRTSRIQHDPRQYRPPNNG